MAGNSNPAFEVFMEEVDKHIDEVCGMSHEDIPDYDYASSWEMGEEPIQTARDALEAAGWSYGF